MEKHKQTDIELVLKKRDIVIHSKLQYTKLNSGQHEALQLYKESGFIYINQYLRNQDIIYDLNRISASIHMTSSKKDDDNLKKIKKDGGKTTLQDFYNFVKKYGPGRLIALIHHIDSIFKKANWPKIGNIKSINTLYKGVGVPANIYNKLVGSVVTFDEYLSTSISSDVAMKFYSWRETTYMRGKENLKPVFFILRKCNKLPFIYLDWKGVYTHKLERLKFDMGDEYELLLPRGCKFKIVKKYKFTEFLKGQRNGSKLALINNYYDNVQDLTPSFFKKPEIKEMLSIPDINVMELEFVEWNKPKPIILTDKPLQIKITPNMLKSQKNTDSGDNMSNSNEPTMVKNNTVELAEKTKKKVISKKKVSKKVKLLTKKLTKKKPSLKK